jgi:hypothetical protein
MGSSSSPPPLRRSSLHHLTILLATPQELIEQARNQEKAARGVPVQWHVAEREMVDILRRHFNLEGIKGIQLIHTLPAP